MTRPILELCFRKKESFQGSLNRNIYGTIFSNYDTAFDYKKLSY
jgi:hypothetical protein